MRVRFTIDGQRAWFAFFLLTPFCGGCVNTMETVSGQRFKQAPFHTTFAHEEPPIETLRKSQDGNDRAKAMLALKEPLRNGGTEAEQFEALQILATAATSDKQAICRMRAIETLGRWEDPRTAQIITVAYENAPSENPSAKPAPDSDIIQAGRRSRVLGPVSSYTGETIVTVRCRALEALGKKRTPEGLKLLCEIASTPVKRDVKPVDLDAPNSGGVGLDQFDLRLAALRALENFKGEMTASQVLYKVMTTEYDVALKDRAYLSLCKVTDKSFEPASSDWKKHLKLPDDAPAGLPAGITKPAP